MMQGNRIPDNEFLNLLSYGLIEPGDYGKQEVEGEIRWFDCTPDGDVGCLAFHEADKNGLYHTITEHEDGTITVGGSILGGPISSRKGWHGWLEHGVWRSV